jgi:hypothetical protein
MHETCGKCGHLRGYHDDGECPPADFAPTEGLPTMPAGPRPRREPTDEWDQRRLLVTSPAQETYELLRPIVLFSQPIPAQPPRSFAVPIHRRTHQSTEYFPYLQKYTDS